MKADGTRNQCLVFLEEEDEAKEEGLEGLSGEHKK